MLCIQAATWEGCHPFAILLLVCKRHADVEISLHCLVLTIYGYTVMQLCSFKMRGVKREENKFYYILIYNNYIFSKKNIQDRQAGKK